FRAGQDLQEPGFDLHHVSLLAWPPAAGGLTMAHTASRRRALAAALSASTFRRSSGSVLEGRRLNHQSAALTVSPSSSPVRTPGRLPQPCLDPGAAPAPAGPPG